MEVFACYALGCPISNRYLGLFGVALVSFSAACGEANSWSPANADATDEVQPQAIDTQPFSMSGSGPLGTLSYGSGPVCNVCVWGDGHDCSTRTFGDCTVDPDCGWDLSRSQCVSTFECGCNDLLWGLNQCAGIVAAQTAAAGVGVVGSMVVPPAILLAGPTFSRLGYWWDNVRSSNTVKTVLQSTQVPAPSQPFLYGLPRGCSEVNILWHAHGGLRGNSVGKIKSALRDFPEARTVTFGDFGCCSAMGAGDEFQTSLQSVVDAYPKTTSNAGRSVGYLGFRFYVSAADVRTLSYAMGVPTFFHARTAEDLLDNAGNSPDSVPSPAPFCFATVTPAYSDFGISVDYDTASKACHDNLGRLPDLDEIERIPKKGTMLPDGCIWTNTMSSIDTNKRYVQFVGGLSSTAFIGLKAKGDLCRFVCVDRDCDLGPPNVPQLSANWLNNEPGVARINLGSRPPGGGAHIVEYKVAFTEMDWTPLETTIGSHIDKMIPSPNRRLPILLRARTGNPLAEYSAYSTEISLTPKQVFPQRPGITWLNANNPYRVMVSFSRYQNNWERALHVDTEYQIVDLGTDPSAVGTARASVHLGAGSSDLSDLTLGLPTPNIREAGDTGVRYFKIRVRYYFGWDTITEWSQDYSFSARYSSDN